VALDIKIASPCPADWNKMTGDDRIRHCAQCDLSVYNFAALSESEIKTLISAHEDKLCVRLYRRGDGTLITRDCPVGFQMKVHRVSRIAGVALSAAMTAVPATAQSLQSQYSGLVRIDDRSASIQIEVKDWNGAIVRNAVVYLSSNALDFEAGKATDEYGRAEISNLVAGTYDVSVVAEDYGTPRQVLVLTGGETAHLEVQLDISDMLQGGPSGSTISHSEHIEIPIRTDSVSLLPLQEPAPPSQSWIKKLLHKLR
jgi:hypothetical protein